MTRFKFSPCLSLTISFLLITSLLPFTSYSQSFDDLPGFGEYSREEINLKKCEFDPEANAVVLMDLARSSPNDQQNLVTEHRTRIKILNEKGFDQATIAIPYYRRDDFEFISNIKGTITNYDASGHATTVDLERKSIYDVKVNEWRSEQRFTMPNVKAGSIFEYSYTSTMKHYGGLEDWVFQTDIPTIKSRYYLYIIPNAEFAYQVYKLPTIPIKITNDKSAGSVTFEMDNIAALRDEPYMDSRRDNLQRVVFQLSGYNRNGSGMTKYNTSWEEVAYDVLGREDFGNQLHKSLSGTEEFIKQTKLLPNAYDRLLAVYQFVQQRMGWNGYVSKFSPDGVRKAWEKGSGTSGDVNIAFINILQDVGVDAVPLLVSDRHYNKINISYPFLDEFHQTIAYIALNGKTYFIDASDKTTPLHMIPYNLLNTYGYLVLKKKGKLLLLENKDLYYENTINIIGEILENGTLNGNVIERSKDYAKLERKNYYKKAGSEKFLERYFHEAFTNIKADSLELNNLDNDTLSLEQKTQFTQTLNTSGDYTLLSYHLFSGIPKNPFSSDIRFSDINFGSPQRFTVNQSIALPANFVVDELPKNISLITADSSFKLIRRIALQGDRIGSQLKLEINQSLFKQEDYEMLQAFFKKMQGILDEQIVLKKKQ